MSEGVRGSLAIQYRDIFKNRAVKNEDATTLLSDLLRNTESFWAELLTNVQKKSGISFETLEKMSVFQFFAVVSNLK